MKTILINMSENFLLNLESDTHVFRLENNSCLIKINTPVDNSLTYKLHIQHKDDKEVMLLDKSEEGLSALLSAPYIRTAGNYVFQIEGIKEDYRIISNQLVLNIGPFINAEHIPTPEEMSIIDQILIELNKKVSKAYVDTRIGETVILLESEISKAVKDLETAIESKASTEDLERLAGAIHIDITNINERITDTETRLNSSIDSVDQKVNTKADSSTVEALAETVSGIDSDVTDLVSALAKEIAARKESEAQLKSKIDEKQKKLKEGANITIEEDGTISANIEADVTKEYLEENYYNKTSVDSLIESKADSSEVEALRTELANKADKTALAETDRNVDLLFKLTQGQAWDFVDQTEHGMNVAPKGTKVQSLLSVEGKSEQFSTNGYNLLSSQYTDGKSLTLNGITYTVLDDGSVLVNGTSTADSHFYFNRIPNKVVINQGNCALKWLYDYYDSFGVNLQCDIYNSNDVYVGTVQRTSAMTYADAYSYGACRIRISEAGVTVNNLRVYPMLYNTAHTVTSYEPYTGGIPSPNPDYPQEITSVEELDFNVSNREYVAYIPNVNIEANGYVSRNYNFGVLVFVGRVGHSISGNVMGIFKEIPKFKDYTMNGIRYLGDTIVISEKCFIGVRIKPVDEYSIVTIDGVRKRFMTSEIEGLVSYQKTITPPFSLNKIGDYADFADVEKGTWNRNVGIRVFDGSENYTKFEVSEGNLFRTDIKYLPGILELTNIGVVMLSDKFVGSSISYRRDGTISGSNRVDFITNKFNSADDFKQWITTNNVNVLYPVALSETPIATEDLQFLKSLQNLDEDNVITVTDQNGNDVTYAMKYLIKLSEAI